MDSRSNVRWKARSRGRLFVRHGHALQRPDALAGKETLTTEEAAGFDAAENTRLNRDLFDPEKGQPSAGYLPRSQGGVLSYNESWYERGNKLTNVVYPP